MTRTRAENVKEAQRLAAAGLTQKQIGERMGAKRTTVTAWLTDPDLSKHKARLASYGGTCEVCGAPTTGTYGPKKGPPTRCNRHHDHDARVAAMGLRRWSRELVIAQIHRWVDEYGQPPAATDWNPPHAISQGQPERAERYYRDGGWPLLDTVQQLFGSWNAGIEAAGYTPRRPGDYERTPEVRRKYSEAAKRRWAEKRRKPGKG